MINKINGTQNYQYNNNINTQQAHKKGQHKAQQQMGSGNELSQQISTVTSDLQSLSTNGQMANIATDALSELSSASNMSPQQLQQTLSDIASMLMSAITGQSGNNQNNDAASNILNDISQATTGTKLNIMA